MDHMDVYDEMLQLLRSLAEEFEAAGKQARNKAARSKALARAKEIRDVIGRAE